MVQTVFLIQQSLPADSIKIELGVSRRRYFGFDSAALSLFLFCFARAGTVLLGGMPTLSKLLFCTRSASFACRTASLGHTAGAYSAVPVGSVSAHMLRHAVSPFCILLSSESSCLPSYLSR